MNGIEVLVTTMFVWSVDSARGYKKANKVNL